MKSTLFKTSALAGVLAFAGGIAHADVTLDILIDNAEDTVAFFTAVAEAYEAANPDVNIELETRPGGGEGDNIIKSRLATGEMSDIFAYNSGSLFQALKPERTLLDLSDLPAQERIIDSFKPTVTGKDGKIYGVPVGTTMGGGIFYNIPIYEELGLEIPKTWDEFMANNAKIKAAGKVAVAGTFKDTWSSQLFVLADYFNVQASEPDFAERYTNNQAKYAASEAAMAGFQHLQEVFEGGYMNEDFGAATFPDGMKLVGSGGAAHYPMLTFGIGMAKQAFPDLVNNIGFFAQPGSSADSNGLTVWMPGGVYVAKETDHPEEAKAFADWFATKEVCDISLAINGPQGPFAVKGCTLPDDIPPAMAGMMPYFQEDGRTAPALEFLSPIKGPALEQITVEVGSGIRSAEEGAALYDQDVVKQAKQLGLPGWD